MKVYRIVLPAATVSCIILPCLLQLGCGKSRQVNPGQGEASEERVRNPEQEKSECLRNLSILDAAKEEWALVEKKWDGDDIIKSEVGSYIKGGGPTCPSGGTYTYGRIGEDPTCSVPGHVLP